MATDRSPALAATVIDSRTLQSTRESGARAGYDGAKRRKGSKVHLAVDTLGYLLTLHVTPADQQDREQVATLAHTVQEVTGGAVEVAFVDQGYTGEPAQTQAQDFGVKLVVVKHTQARRGFVLPPRRWVVQRSIAWAARFRRHRRTSQCIRHAFGQSVEQGSIANVGGTVQAFLVEARFVKKLLRTCLEMQSSCSEVPSPNRVPICANVG